MTSTSKRTRSKIDSHTSASLSHSEHFVQFYVSDGFLLDSVSEFISAGLSAGDACIIIGTLAHRASLEQRLLAGGLDVAAAHERGDYIALDAAETLSRFMADGTPDPERFTEVVGSLIAYATQGQRHASIFGEMVALLWSAGNQAAAVRLEELWDELANTAPYPFSLCCAYPMQNFAGEANGAQFIEICGRHSRVIPDESYTALSTADERSRAITALQQKAASLEAEIAERKLAEKRLQIALAASETGTFRWNPLTDEFLEFDHNLKRLFGFPPSAPVSVTRDIIARVHQDDAPAVRSAIDRCRTGADFEMEYRVVLPDGRLRWLYARAKTERDTSGRPTYLVGACTDITQRKLAEALVLENAERLHLIAEAMPQKIYTATPSGAVDYFNPQWMEFTGLPFAEIRDWGWTQFVHSDDVEENVQLWRHAIETGEPFYFEHRFRRADGVYCWHVSRATPTRAANGDITMWIGSSTDIDEQKRLEERKNAFISMASHELKTPVTSLKGFTQVLQLRLKQQQADAQTLLFLNRMNAQLGKLTNLISDLLDVSRMQTGTIAFRESCFDLDEMVRETVENVQAATVTHRLSLDGETHAQVRGDRDRLGQALINLLTNAVKYSPQADTVTVRLSADQGWAEVAVCDHGIGITAEYHERIFDQFYQVADPQESTYPGLGIGLYIARTLIERHGGRMWLESQKGAGSVFHFTLPTLAEQSVYLAEPGAANAPAYIEATK